MKGGGGGSIGLAHLLAHQHRVHVLVRIPMERRDRPVVADPQVDLGGEGWRIGGVRTADEH